MMPPWFTRPQTLFMWAAMWASLASSVFAQQVAAESHKRNVLLLVCDDLNCDLGCYGHKLVQSPHIDALARRGLRFERSYCQYPLCGPSRASFMTGLYPDQTLVHRNAIYIREHTPNVVTLPQYLRGHGYIATRIGKIFHYNVPRHIGTGGHDDPDSWDFTFNPRGRDRDDEPLIFSLRPGSFGGTLSWLAAEGADEEQTDGIAAQQAVWVLQRYARHKTPFFLAVGLYRPHTPYVAPRAYFDRYPLSRIQTPTTPPGYLDTLPEPARRSLTQKKEQNNLPDGLARQAIQAYYASITFADRQIGQILDALHTSGLEDNTIVVMTSDHGYHMGEHGYFQKTTLFENAARVPLIIAAPGPEAHGAVTEAMAEMVDLFPTLAQLCGLEPPPGLPGVSLAEVLSDPAAAPRNSALTQYNNGYSLRTPRYRWTSWGADGALGVELYDHVSDPEELVNLAGRQELAEVSQLLARRLKERVERARLAPSGVTQIRNQRRAPRP